MFSDSVNSEESRSEKWPCPQRIHSHQVLGALVPAVLGRGTRLIAGELGHCRTVVEEIPPALIHPCKPKSNMIEIVERSPHGESPLSKRTESCTETRITNFRDYGEHHLKKKKFVGIFIICSKCVSLGQV